MSHPFQANEPPDSARISLSNCVPRDDSAEILQFYRVFAFKSLRSNWEAVSLLRTLELVDAETLREDSVYAALARLAVQICRGRAAEGPLLRAMRYRIEPGIEAFLALFARRLRALGGSSAAAVLVTARRSAQQAMLAGPMSFQQLAPRRSWQG